MCELEEKGGKAEADQKLEEEKILKIIATTTTTTTSSKGRKWRGT